MSYTRHIAGEFEDQKQQCVICGYEICNYEHAMFAMGSSAPRGWATGAIYISDSKNPTIFLTTEPEGEMINDCKPS